MSDLIIKIGDNELDLNEDETIAITKQAAKVGEFSTVLADGTNEVTIPLTPNNKRTLDNAHLIETDSNKPYERLDATLIQEGYETVQDGYGVIKSSANNFSLQVVGGNASFFNRIKDLNLRDLDFSEYDHFWTNQETYNYRNTTEGLIYSVFEQSEDVDTMNTYGTNLYAVNTNKLLPSFFLKSIVDKIFEEQVYQFDTDLIGQDIYDNAIIFEPEFGSRGNDMSYHESTIRNAADQTTNVGDANSFRLFDSATVDAPTNSYTSGTPFEDALQDSGGKKFGITDNCTVTLNASLEIQSVGSAIDVEFRIEHTTPTGIVEVVASTDTIVAGTNTYTFSVTFDCETYNGDNYFTPLIQYVTPTFQSIIVKQDSTYTVSDVVLKSNTSIRSIFPFNYVANSMFLPDMKQGEFLKEIAKIYQWIFDVNERNRTVTAKRFDEIKDNIPNAIDLSNKIDANDIEIEYGINGFAQTNVLKYKEDDISKYDGIGYINVADINLKAEKNFVTMSQFAATSTRLRFDTVNAPYVPVFQNDEPTNGLATRIFIANRVTFPYNINFARVGDTPSNIPTFNVTFAYFAEAGNSDSLDFPTLIDRFYQTVIDMNNKAKTIKAKVNLNIKDVINYDPLTPVYISHLGNYFYWEKLSNYVKGKLTKCIFVKI